MPAGSGAKAPVAQLDRALPSEGKGREFESRRVRHFLRKTNPSKYLAITWPRLLVQPYPPIASTSAGDLNLVPRPISQKS